MTLDARVVDTLSKITGGDAGVLRDRFQGAGSPQDVRAFPVAFGLRAEIGGYGRVASFQQLVVGPDEERSLSAFGVGILGGEEAAPLVPHLPQEVVEGLDGYPPVSVFAGRLPRMDVQARELGVVVEHLLEVGDVPEAVQ